MQRRPMKQRQSDMNINQIIRFGNYPTKILKDSAILTRKTGRMNGVGGDRQRDQIFGAVHSRR